VLPILGGALADRYGYRRMLLVAFSFLCTGYFIAGNVEAYGLVFLGLLVMATGAGLFKPIISGTIARTTTVANSAFGFGVYYWMINLGAFAAPLLVTYLKGFSWSYVFAASALYTGLMLLPTLALFKDPPRPETTKRIDQVLKDAALVLGDARFMLMILVYSGFWILYFQNFGSVLWYLRDFIDPTPINAVLSRVGLGFTFSAEHVTVINALTIIALQVGVSALVKNRPALPTIVVGIGIGALGFVLLASSTSIWVFMAGIAVFSVGEMTAHPKYYSYIGLVAPADKKAVYMGYAFLYGVIGSLIGANAGGTVYGALIKPLVGTDAGPVAAQRFWWVFAGLGVIAALGMVVYNRIFGEDTLATRERARRVMVAVYVLLLAVGSLFIYLALRAPEVNYKTLVQAALMLLLGSGGLAINLRRQVPT